MTWYWWSHWFWITFVHVLIKISSNGAIDIISQLNTINHYNNKREPLKFPLAVDSDSIFDADNENHFKSDTNENEPKWTGPSDKVINNMDLYKNNNENNGDHILVDYPTKNNFSNVNNNSDTKDILNNSNNNNNSFDKIDKINTNYNINATITNESTNATINSSNVLSTSTKDVLATISVYSNSTEFGYGDSSLSENNISSSSAENHSDSSESIVFQENDTRTDFEHFRRKAKILKEFRDETRIENITDETKSLLARSAEVIAQPQNDINNGDSLSLQALSIQDEQTILNIGAISGICATVIGCFFAFSLTGIVLYRRRYINKPQTLSEPDSSGYIDDSTIRDNSDEMYSLDNDSFLNSLEAMTIQNYWTENVKHTKL